MSGMLWIALELSVPKIGFDVMLSLTVKTLDAFKFDGVAESDNAGDSFSFQPFFVYTVFSFQSMFTPQVA